MSYSTAEPLVGFIFSAIKVIFRSKDYSNQDKSCFDNKKVLFSKGPDIATSCVINYLGLTISRESGTEYYTCTYLQRYMAPCWSLMLTV